MKTIHLICFICAISLFGAFSSCTKDPCEGSLCLNNGICVDGGCDCTVQFQGANCDEQRTPDEIRLRSIQLTRFPETNNGIKWDANDGPDLYFRLYEGTTPLAQPSLDVTNADASQDYYFFINIIDISNVMNEHTLQLRDYDKEDDDDIMGEVKFVPYFMTNGFPYLMTLDNGDQIAFNIELEYMYNTIR